MEVKGEAEHRLEGSCNHHVGDDGALDTEARWGSGLPDEHLWSNRNEIYLRCCHLATT